ncbi:MAG TPA: ribonuclease R [Bavariicoccus seileri]|uniref:Ribonuclease R n=1 Tax=Bavariicoccus seileri TaxID=549685 RepID=A0A3D4S461_9ENTE|nr:ribonuclease R [Bavariicoccus seileri]HCS93282.1 ribonuclease R [Bavariicoccus seileri]
MSQSFIPKIRAFFKNDQKAYNVRDLSQNFEAHSADDFKQLVKDLATLEKSGEITITDQGEFASTTHHRPDEIVGSFSRHEKGFGFVSLPDEEAQDVYIDKRDTFAALDGDTVAIKITRQARPGQTKGPEGKITRVVRHGVTQLVGTFTLFSPDDRISDDYIGYIVPQDKHLAPFKCLITDSGLKPVTGTVVLVEITEYPTRQHPAQLVGIVKEEIGYKDAPGVDILSILVELGIPDEFPEEVITDAKKVPDTIHPDELSGRIDLRDQLTITIDGADAKDLDDAISFKQLDNGHYKLGVYIADVSYYVTEGSPLDQEAYERGTSVYVTDRVVPMLPQRLSNGICSLHPHVDRLAMGCEMEFDENGDQVSYKIFPTVINSDYRMTYDEVNLIFSHDPDTLAKYQGLLPWYESMKGLHEILSRHRENRGAIDFETTEAVIKLDDDGHPIEITARERGEAEKMIESFMLAANETVARHFKDLEVPFLYRIHEQPSNDRILRFMEFIRAFGQSIELDGTSVRPEALQALLKRIKGEPFEPLVSIMMLRSMQQAKYSTEPLGHFGLASPDYTHFTSPIRRYPDLIVHRMIRFYEQHGTELNDQEEHRLESQLGDIAEHSSLMERKAVQAERDTDQLKKAEYMAGHVGEVFPGVISSVLKFGLFVELPNTVEGLVHISTMNDDYYNYIDSHMTLVGERTGKSFKIGDPITVRVSRADIESREIDFELVLPKGQEKGSANHGQSTDKSSQLGHKGQSGQSGQSGKNAYPSNHRNNKKQGKGKNSFSDNRKKGKQSKKKKSYQKRQGRR